MSERAGDALRFRFVLPDSTVVECDQGVARALYAALVGYLADLPAPPKDESVGSHGGDPRMMRGGPARPNYRRK